MKINIKYVLSGLNEGDLNHPAVNKIIEQVRSNYEETGNGESILRWIEETYGK